MELETICLAVGVLSVAVSVVQIIITKLAFKKYSDKGMLVTNNHIVHEMTIVVLFDWLIYRMFIRDNTLEGALSIEQRYIVAIIGFLAVMIYMLTKIGYINRQYVFGDSHFYEVKNNMAILPYSYIQIMYRDVEKPEKITMFINYKKYFMNMDDDTYEEIKSKLNPAVLQNSEKIDKGDAELQKSIVTVRVLIAVFAVVFMGFAVALVKGVIPKNYAAIAGAVVVVLMVGLLILIIVTTEKKNARVKKIIKGEILQS